MKILFAVLAAALGSAALANDRALEAVESRLLGVVLPSVPPDFPPTDQALPGVPAGYPPDLREAMHRYLRVVTPFQRLLEAQKPTIDFQTHQPEYEALRDELVTGKSGPFTDRVLAYRWGGWCGTGSDRFRTPQSVAVLLALVTDQRWTEAAGAALRVVPPAGGKGPARILAGLVPDPETVVTGGLALADLGSRDYGSDCARLSLLALLLQLPGDGRVETLIQLADCAPPTAIADYVRALGKLVPVAPAPVAADTGAWIAGSSWTSGPTLDGIAVQSVGPAAEKAALDFLCAKATAEAPLETARELADILRAKRQPTSIPALKRLLDHPSLEVARDAAEALEILGEKVSIPPKLGPVRYALRHKGTPLANRAVNWTLQRGSSSVSAEAKTNADGLIEIPRDHFLADPADPIRAVALRSATLATPADPWFGLLLPAPPSSDQPVPVEIPTTTLRLTWKLPRDPGGNEQMEIILWGLQDAENQRVGFWSPARLTVPVADSLEFAALGPGTYRAEIRLPGTTGWTGNLEAGTGSTHAIPLARASDVRFTLVPPGRWIPAAFRPELWQDGKRVSVDWDSEKRLFRGVPAGAYRLRIPSSAEIRKTVFGLLPDGPEFGETEVPFSIAPDAPPVINLGTIAFPAGDPPTRPR